MLVVSDILIDDDAQVFADLPAAHRTSQVEVSVISASNSAGMLIHVELAPIAKGRALYRPRERMPGTSEQGRAINGGGGRRP